MKKPMRALFGAASLVFASAAVPAHAQVSYECSGIGLDERQTAERIPHTLRVEYAQPDGHYLGGAETTVSDASGNQLVSVRCPGPWVLLQLPDGRYIVTATFGDQTKSSQVTISGGQRQRQLFVF